MLEFLPEKQVLRCGIEIALLTVGFLATAAATTFAIMQSQRGNQDQQSPASLDDFQITQAKEGSVIPWIIGRVRIAGNIIDFRNLTTKAVKSKSGGKGGGGGSAVSGYKYYLDVWQGIGRGKLNLIKKYVQDKEQTIVATNEVFNDGENGLYPTWVTDAQPLPGISHIAWRQWFLGENVQNVPTVHFVVERVSTSGVANANLANGTNPAAAIYDILLELGVPAGNINLTSFNAAANYWNSRGYGLNFEYTSKLRGEDAINRVFGFVDGVLYRDENNRIGIRALNPADSYVATLTEKDIEGLSLNRKTWQQVPNKFRATFVEEVNDFTERVIVAENPAAIKLAGREIHASLDLSCFRDISTASKRLFEVMKRESYPGLEIKFKASLKYSTLRVGEVIRISHSLYGIVASDFRITKITSPEVTQNTIEINAKQMVETLHDDVFVIAGGADFTELNPTPVNLTKIKIFEVPYNEQTGFEPAWLILCSREAGFETGYDVLVSNQSTQDFETFGTFSTFSQYGTLTQSYPSTTNQIDDTQTLRFTPYNSFDSFDTISRAQLFAVQKVAVIGDEMLGFEKFLPQGDGSVILQGVRRGLLGTPIQTHNINAGIYLTFVASNVLSKVRFQNFYVKLLPRFLANVLDSASATSTNVVTSYKARKPRNPGRLKAVRTGSDIALQIYPSTPGVLGAGDSFPIETDQPPPFPFLGDFQISYASTTIIIGIDSTVITQAGSVNVTVKSRLNGYVSSGKIITVGASDGTYYA